MDMESVLLSMAGINPLEKPQVASPLDKVAETDGSDNDKAPQDQDTVNISEQARKIAEAAKGMFEGLGAASVEQSETEDTSQIKIIENRIKQLEKELQEVKESDLPEKQKNQEIQSITAELMELRQQLLELQNGGVAMTHGGTRAQGFGSSLT